jgi:hypothetical protein
MNGVMISPDQPLTTLARSACCCIFKDAAIPSENHLQPAVHRPDLNAFSELVVVSSGTPCSARCHHSHLLFIPACTKFQRHDNCDAFSFFYTSFGRAYKYVLYLIYDEFDKKKKHRMCTNLPKKIERSHIKVIG